MTSPEITVVIPAKDESDSVPELSQWISRVMQAHGFSYEVIFIDDGSEDDTWEQIRKVSLADSRFKGIRFNRNFGKSAALQTGFRAARGKAVITMDADLRHEAIEHAEELHVVVEAVLDEVVEAIGTVRRPATPRRDGRGCAPPTRP